MQKTILRRGLMFVLSSPSGAGKTTIAKALLERDSTIKLSISKTTRPPRMNEIDGKDYIFTDKENFLKDIENELFLEYACVFDNYYGTPKKDVFDLLEQGKDVLFDIDWQGTQQIHAKAPQDLVRIFILPPSMDILKERLKNRGTETQEIYEKRLNMAYSDITHFAEYDYVLINDNVEESIKNIHIILEAERLKRHRLVGMVDFVNKMRYVDNEE
ncbi:MAG: guanylate kinase [Proteobacteria bacterium]|nr:guanylate kinase [Pseudomonadota bacterium]